MARTHKRQHTVPRSYLHSWIEPVTPPGQHAAIQLVSKKDQTVRRKSPEKTFTETDRYTVMLRDGTRHLAVENYLGDIENDFQGVIRAVRANEALTLLHRAKLATFTAAMLGRSKKQGDWMMQQFRGIQERLRDLETRMNAAPRTSKEMEDYLRNLNAQLVVGTIQAAAPVLFQMSLTICTTDDVTGFITSDAPAVMFNPRGYTFPPQYQSPGLMQRDIEVTLPLAPKHLAVFTHRPDALDRVALSESSLNEINRTTCFCAEEYIVVRTGTVNDFWFSEREKPADAWDPDSTRDLDTTGLNEADTVVAQFQNAKAFHDDWRRQIFIDAPPETHS
jgi:hypothetical protein